MFDTNEPQLVSIAPLPPLLGLTALQLPSEQRRNRAADDMHRANARQGIDFEREIAIDAERYE